MPVTVTQKALLEMIREVMWNKEYSSWSSNSTGHANVNSEVDPSIAVTDPVNPNFRPHDKTEFAVAVNQLVKNLPDSDMPGLFDAIKASIKDEEKEKEEADMKTKALQGGSEHVEEAVRKAIRKILMNMGPERVASISEAKPPKEFGPVVGPLPPVKKIPAGVHGGEYSRRLEKNKADLKRGLGKAAATIDAPVRPEELGIEEPANASAPEVGDGVPNAPESGEDVSPKRRAYKSTALGGMSDVGGASFEQIAKELGFSVAGAKQAVDKALEKARFVAVDMDEDDREILVLTAINDYIKYLTRSGELTSTDVQLMKDHPDIVRELDGFREFLHNHIRRARKADQRIVNPLDDEDMSTPTVVDVDDDDDVASDDVYDLDGTEQEEYDEEPRPAVRAPAAAPAPGAGKSYKIYPGGRRYGGKPVVTRYKGTVYGPSGETSFSPNEQGIVSLDGDKLKVKKPDSDHTQTWDAVGESRQPVLYLNPRNKR